MVSFTVYRANSGGAYVEGVCLATDEKPVAGITNGSILFAVDTTDGTLTRYMFDQNSATWIETECPCSGGGSGGGGEGGGGNVLVVPLTVSVDDESAPVYTATKTAGEMAAADVLVYTYEPAGIPGMAVTAMGSFSAVNTDGFYFVLPNAFPRPNEENYIGLEALSADAYPSSESSEPGPDDPA